MPETAPPPDIANGPAARPSDDVLPAGQAVLAPADPRRAAALANAHAYARHSELVALQVEDVALVANGLRIRILRGKTDRAGEGTEIGLPRGMHVETCPERAFKDWQDVAKRSAGPLFRRISTGGRILDTAGRCADHGSPPVRGRGSKHLNFLDRPDAHRVAPRAGA